MDMAVLMGVSQFSFSRECVIIKASLTSLAFSHSITLASPPLYEAVKKTLTSTTLLDFPDQKPNKILSHVNYGVCGLLL
jgi:hypothetical protein